MAFGDLSEREAERSATLAAIDRCVGGEGAALAFEAAAGVGKTSLLQAVCEAAQVRGARVLSARGLELEQTLDYALVGQLLAPALAGAVGDERKRLLGGPARPAGPVVGLSEASPVTGTRGALNGLYWLCANLCARDPVVLAVDDAHWADDASLRFFVHLTRRFGSLRLLLAFTVRPAERGASRPLLDALLDDEAIDLQRPRALQASGTATIVRRRLGAEASDALCGACHTATGGNPHLIGEIARALRDDRIDLGTADARAIEQIGPRTISRSMLVRLSRMGPDAVELARAIAIFPDGAEFRHVSAIACLDETAAARAADRLVDGDLLARGRPTSFLRPLTRTAVYEDLPAASRALLHLRAARILRAEGADPGAIAVHLLSTEPGAEPAAFGDLLAAAGAALGAGDAEASTRFLDRALEEPVTASARTPALYMRGVAGMLAGSGCSSGGALAVLEDPAGLEPAVLRDLARVLAFGSRTAEAVAALDEAVAASDGRDADLCSRCVIDRTWVLWSNDDTVSRYAADTRAIDVGERPGGLLEHAMAASWSAQEAWRYDNAERAATVARRSVRGGLLAAQGSDGLAPLSFAALALALADHPREGLTALQPALAARRGAGSGGDIALTYGHLAAASIRLYAGDLRDAERDLQLARECAGGQVAGTEHERAIGTMLAAVMLERSAPAAAQELLDGLATAPTWTGLHLLAVRAHVTLAAGHVDEALDDLGAARRAAADRGMRNPLYPIPWGGDIALAAAAIGDRDRARRQADEDLAQARQFGAAGAVGYALRIAGLVAGGEQGIALLSEAAATLAASSARLLYTETLIDLGAALRRANQRAAARRPLRLAIDLAGRCGAERLLQRATEEQLASGGRPRRAFVTGVESLTPSERRVARLAASGLTNREISQQLYVTLKTVEMHVGNALGKLGISSRRQLVGIVGLRADEASAA